MIERARQFASFSPLKGFDLKISEKEKIIVPRHELLEDKAMDLTIKLNSLKAGDMAKIIYYYDGEYIKKEGVVSKINFELQKMTVVKEDIYFVDIWDIEK